MDRLLKWVKRKNLHFYLRIILISSLPILTAMKIETQDIYSWSRFFEVIKSFINNPYLVGIYIVTLHQTFKQTCKVNKKIIKGENQNDNN